MSVRLVREVVGEEYLAALLPSKANFNQFEKNREHLSNILAMGDDHCLKSVVAYLSMLDTNNVKAINKCQPHLHKSETEEALYLCIQPTLV